MLELQEKGRLSTHVPMRRNLISTLCSVGLCLAPLGAKQSLKPKIGAPSRTALSVPKPPMIPENSWLYVHVPLKDGKAPSLFTQLPGNLDQLASSWRTWARKAMGSSPERWTAVEVSLLHGSEGQYPQGTILISFTESSPSPSGKPETTQPRAAIRIIPSPFSGKADWAMTQTKGRIWISNHKAAIQNALRLQAGEAGNLFLDPDLASLWKNAPQDPEKILVLLRPLGLRKTLLQAPLGATLRRIIKSPLGTSKAILLKKNLQSSSEEWILLGSAKTSSSKTQVKLPGDQAAKSHRSIPQIQNRSWLWTAKNWETWLKELPAYGQTPDPLPLLPALAETLAGSLGDQDKQAWSSSMGREILWLGPLPEQKGGGVLIPITNPIAVRKSFRAAGAKEHKSQTSLGEAPFAQLLWIGSKGKLQIEIQKDYLLLSTPGFDLGGLDLVGNTLDLPGSTTIAGALSGLEFGVRGIPNRVTFQVQELQQGASRLSFQNIEGSLPFWGTLSKALGTLTASSHPSLATQEDPALLQEILRTLSLETDPAKAKLAIQAAKSSKNLETLRSYAGMETPEIAALAIEALGTLKDQKSAPLFEKGIRDDQNPLLRRASAYALSRLGTAKSRKLLRALFMDSDARVRLYALKGQNPKNLSGKDLKTLVQLVDTWTKDEAMDRSQALLLIHDQGDPRSLDHLALTPAGGSRFQQALVYTFQELSPKLKTGDEVKVLRKALRSRNQALQRYAIQRLGALGTQEAIATLQEESKRLAGTPLAPALRTSLEANSAGPGLGDFFRKAKNKALFWFRSSLSWLRRQDPLTQKAIALSPITLLLLFGIFWGLGRRKRRIKAQVEIQELLKPSSEEMADHAEENPYLHSEEDMVSMQDEEDAYAGSLYSGKE